MYVRRVRAVRGGVAGRVWPVGCAVLAAWSAFTGSPGSQRWLLAECVRSAESADREPTKLEIRLLIRVIPPRRHRGDGNGFFPRIHLLVPPYLDGRAVVALLRVACCCFNACKSCKEPKERDGWG